MYPYDEEEDKYKLDPVNIQPTNLSTPQPMNPVVQDSIMQKFKLGPYSDQARQDLEQSSAPNGFDAIASALGAVSAGFGGRDPVAAATGIIGKAQERGQNQLSQFDKGRANQVQEIGLNREEEKYQKEKKDETEDDDPNSAKSKIQQGLAAKMVPGKDFSGIPSSKLTQLIPSLTKIYEIDQKKLDRQDARATKLEDAKTKKEAEGTIGQKKVDQDYAKDYLDWTTSGKPTLEKNLALLENAKKELASPEGQNLSGRFTGRKPDIFQSEDAIRVRDNVQQAAQGSLRAILGAQFTENEGKRIMQKAYNPNVSPEENIKKLDSAIQELKAHAVNADQKAAHFEKNGSLKGLRTLGSPMENESLQAKGAPQEVERLDKASGKIGIFNPETKQFIRWK
jgi:hypothetical protein